MRVYYLNKSLKVSTLLLGLLLWGCDDYGDVDGWTHVAWSPDQSGVALLTGEDQSQLLVGSWPGDSWVSLALAPETHRFLHPLWLQGSQGEWLISVFEIATSRSSGQEAPDDVRLRIFKVSDGVSMEHLAEPASREIMALKELETLQPGPDRTSLIYAGHLEDRYEVRELRLGSSGSRTILSSHAVRCSARISGDGKWVALLEETAYTGALLSIYATHAAWDGPVSIWRLSEILSLSYMGTPYRWRLREWSPDAVWLLMEGRSAVGPVLLLLRPIDLITIPLPHRGILQEAAWSSTGRYLGYREEIPGPGNPGNLIINYDVYSNKIHLTRVDVGVQLLACLDEGKALLYSKTGRAITLGSLDPRSRAINPILVADSNDMEILVSPSGRKVIKRDHSGER